MRADALGHGNTPPSRGTEGGRNGAAGPGHNGNGTNGHAQERADEKPEIMVPGTHPQPAEANYWQSNDTFADQALEAMPADLLYRSTQTIGLVTGAAGEKQFDPADTSDGRLLVDEHVRLVRWYRDQQTNRPKAGGVPCSESHAKLVLARARRSAHTRELVRLVSYPVYDRALHVSPPGWKAGTYYDQPPGLRGLEAQRDTETIRQVLDDLVCDFPFKDEESRENFFGLLLTPLLRPALDGNAPLHLVHAPLERTGKSKLLEEVLGGVIQGRPTPALQLTASDEEIDKRVTALLLSGETLVHLDNLGEYVDSPALASLLTSSVYQGRELGKSTMRRMANTLTVTGSGNNVRFTGELAKRTVPICLQPLDDQPELRKAFAHPHLRAYVSQIRRDVLAALLGMVSNWIAAGRPAGEKPMGGFEQWARTIGGILQVNGYSRWLENLSDFRRQADPNGEDLKSFIAAWELRFGGAEKSATELLILAQEEHLFAGFLRGSTASQNLPPFSRKVLAPAVDRPVGHRIVRKLASGSNSRYRLEPSDGKPLCPREEVP